MKNLHRLLNIKGRRWYGPNPKAAGVSDRERETPLVFICWLGFRTSKESKKNG